MISFDYFKLYKEGLIIDNKHETAGVAVINNIQRNRILEIISNSTDQDLIDIDTDDLQKMYDALVVSDASDDINSISLTLKRIRRIITNKIIDVD